MKVFVLLLLSLFYLVPAWSHQIKLQSFVVASKDFAPIYIHKVTPQDTYSLQSKDKKTLVNVDIQNISFLKKPHTCEEQFKVFSQHLSKQGVKEVSFTKKNLMKNSDCQISYRRNGQSILQNIFINQKKKEQLTLTAVSTNSLSQMNLLKSHFEVKYVR